MEPHRVPDYNQISSTYDSRYNENGLNGIADALARVREQSAARMILEVGCGTGRWLQTLAADGATTVGVDASAGMLTHAAGKLDPRLLIAGKANQLPFTGKRFDMICCVNALHHFDSPEGFIANVPTLLTSHGVLAIVAIDPRTVRHRYHYDFFDGAREVDIRRYPSFGQLIDWMFRSGMSDVELRVVERSRRQFAGSDVLGDPFLRKESDSTLALLSDEAYAAGIERIHQALRPPEGAIKPAVFRSDMDFCIITGVCNSR